MTASEEIEAVPTIGAMELAPLVNELATGGRLRNLRDSVATNTWKAYKQDLADYATWMTNHGKNSWSEPLTIVAYLEFLETTAGAKYSTISRRVTAIHKLVEAEAHLTNGAVRDGALYVMDPTKDIRVNTALKAIRRRIANENTPRSKNKAATAIDGSKLLQILLSLDPDTPAGVRDKALLLIGWYGALRRSEIAGMRREHLSIDDNGIAIELPITKSDQTDPVWVPIPRQPGRQWDPVHALEQWMQLTDAAGITRPPKDSDVGRAETPIWLAIHRGGRIMTDPISAGAVNQLVQRHARCAGIQAHHDQGFSAHSLRAGFITEAKARGVEEGDIMKHSRHKSLQMMMHYNQGTWWTRNAASNILL